MKKWNKILMFLAFLAGIGACETEMMDYEGRPGVYFHVQAPPPSGYGDKEIWERIDTSKILFTKTVEDEIEVDLPVRAMGDVVNYDRYFEIKLVDTATTAKLDENYTPIATRYTMPADTMQTSIKFRIKRPATADTTYYITLDLVATNDFDLPMNKWRKLTSDYSEDRLINVVRHVISFNDAMYRPSQWVDNFFGEYTDKKMRLILDITQMILGDFDVYMNGGQKKAIASKIDFYLKTEEAAGRTIYEDVLFDKDGNPAKMKMGPLITN